MAYKTITQITQFEHNMISRFIAGALVKMGAEVYGLRNGETLVDSPNEATHWTGVFKVRDLTGVWGGDRNGDGVPEHFLTPEGYAVHVEGMFKGTRTILDTSETGVAAAFVPVFSKHFADSTAQYQEYKNVAKQAATKFMALVTRNEAKSIDTPPTIDSNGGAWFVKFHRDTSGYMRKLFRDTFSPKQDKKTWTWVLPQGTKISDVREFWNSTPGCVSDELKALQIKEMQNKATETIDETDDLLGLIKGILDTPNPKSAVKNAAITPPQTAAPKPDAANDKATVTAPALELADA